MNEKLNGPRGLPESLTLPTHALVSTSPRREIVFIDARVQDRAALIEALGGSAEVVILDADADGLVQMASYLAGREGVDAIHLISHGASGQVQAGSISIDSDTASAHAEALAEIGAALAADGDFLVYGCNAGAGPEGQSLISTLARLSRADVAASTDQTGAAALGGNWVLEQQHGQIDSVLLQNHPLEAFQSLLAVPANENYDTNAGFNSGATNVFTLDGIKYTLTGSGTYTTTVENNNAFSPLGNNAGDYYLFFDKLALFSLSSVKIEAADGSAFRLLGLSFDIASTSSFSITPQGGTSLNYSSTGVFVTVQGLNLAGNPNFYNITSFTISGTNIDVALDDLIFGAAVALPTITSATYDASSQALVVTGTDFLATAGAANDIAVNKLALTGQGGSYTLTSANVDISSATEFTVTLNATDAMHVNGVLNQNLTSSVSGVTYNLAGAAGFDIAFATAADVTGNGITVSNVSAPTITSASYNASTNTFTVTGTNLVKTIGATNDITVSALTITGEGGATRTLSTTGNVEITSATSFSLTLAGADIAAVAALLNQNGTNSTGGSTYNLAASDDWNSVITNASIADATNALTVTNIPATISSAAYDASAGVLSITATNLTAGDTIDVSKLTLTGQAGATYTLTSPNTTAASATAVSVTLNAADKIAVNGLLNLNGTVSVGGTAFSLAAAANWDATASAPADLTGNAVTVSNVAAPTIISATYDAASNILLVTGTNLVRTVGAANDITVANLTLTGEGGATRILTTGAVEAISATSFSVTLNAADQAVVEQMFNRNGSVSTGGTLYNLAASDDWNSVVTGGNISDATSGVTVLNVPTPTITSATYNASTGVLAVTGTGFLPLTGGANDIVANKFSFTGEGGSSYTLTDTANVDITSSTTFTITVSATDRAGLDPIVNKNGSSSVDATVYNLAAAEDWALGADAAVAIADLTGNAITASGAGVPTVTSATYDSLTNVLTVTGTHFQALAGAANDVNVALLTLTGSGGSHTLTSGNVEITSSTSFSVTLNGGDQLAVEGLLNKNGTSGSSGTVYNIAAADGWLANVALSADLTNNAITVTGNETVAPVLATATVNESTVVLTYTDASALDAINLPLAAAFSVVAGGSANPVTGVAVNALARTVTLTLTTPVVNGQVVTLSYVDPSIGDDANAIQDVPGNDAVSLTNMAVTNLTANQAPLITSGATASVLENAAIATVVYTAVAGDADTGQVLTYSLAGADAGAFSINAATGAVTLQASANFEAKASYAVDVIATDNGVAPLTATRAVTLTVTDINEAPVITSGATASVAENAAVATVVYTAVAVDVDAGQTLTYSLGGADAGAFNVNATTGAVTLKASADFETKASYAFNVIATDSGGAPLAATRAVTLSIINLDEAAPTDPSAPPAANRPATGSVGIAGAAVQGATLTASQTLADADGMGAVSYGWRQDGVLIAGATAATLVLAQAQVGHAITVTASYTDGKGNSEAVTSPATSPVANVNDAPTGEARIAGGTSAGSVLTASNDLADPDGLGAISYQWLRDGAPIASGSGSTYVLVDADIGKSITASASYVDGFGANESALADALVANAGKTIDAVITPGSSAAALSGERFDGPSLPAVRITLLADVKNGQPDPDPGTAVVTRFSQSTPPVSANQGVDNALGTLSFQANLSGPDPTESFSIVFDRAVVQNGFWVTDRQGHWTNLASPANGGAQVVDGNQVRLDFQITDGGAFDADGLVNGAVTVVGQVSDIALSLIGHPPDIDGGFLLF